MKKEKNVKKLNSKVANPNAKRQACEVYSRIVGYIRPVQNWNAGKAEEFKDRKVYDNALTTECGCN